MLTRISFCLSTLLLFGAFRVFAQELTLPSSILENDTSFAKALPVLAKQAIAVYQEPDRDKLVNVVFRLQVVAGEYSEALSTLSGLIELRKTTDPSSAARLLPFAIEAKARAKELTTKIPFDEAFKEEFLQAFSQFDNIRAAATLPWFGGNLKRARNDFHAALEKQKGKGTITLTDAIDLLRKYHFFKSLEAWLPLVDSLTVQDDVRRYVVDKNIIITTPDKVHIAAMLVRPKSTQQPQPTLLAFTIYAGDDLYFTQARTSAAHGYAAVVAYTRGKAHSPDKDIIPYEYDGDDARAVIDWIAHQPWSDGRVGMYGGSYDGFTQWAAAKKLPTALKTIVPSRANNPADGLPMENNVFLFVNYAWAFYTTNNKYLDNQTYFDRNRWNSLNEKWYASGVSYRMIDSMDGTPNKWLQRWLQHPSYDSYWQQMVPYTNDFTSINIPVLTLTGYYDDGQQSALWFLKEHYKFNKNAEHYLVIGPYDHFGTDRPHKDPVLRGYAIDSVAQFDTQELIYQWMDYIFCGAKKPDLLKDKINYQVMGANVWKHASSLARMNNETLTLYLSNSKSKEYYHLSAKKPPTMGFLDQSVDFTDRTTSNNDYYPDLVIGKKPDLSNGFTFISDPFEESVEISGTFSGEIKVIANKKDMDIGVVLYEMMPSGELFHLSYFVGRASYAKDMTTRTLLTPGQLESIPFDRTRMVSRKLSKGSRLLVTLNVNKNAYAQINYGTGKDVSDEDINDAKTSLQIQWRNDSFIRIPVSK